MLLAAHQNAACDGGSHFYLVVLPFHREQNRNLADIIEVLRDLADALFHIVAQCRGNLDVLSSNRECSHETQPLSIYGSTYSLCYLFSSTLMRKYLQRNRTRFIKFRFL